MPITRSVWTDDDGSGTTGTVLNNAELQKIYNNIDGQIASGVWTPVDASGAGLVFTFASGAWHKHDRMVYFTLQVIYPSNVNGLAAKIGGLPYVIQSNAGGAHGYGPGMAWYVTANGTVISPLNRTTGLPHINGDMSGSNFIVSGSYLTT